MVTICYFSMGNSSFKHVLRKSRETNPMPLTEGYFYIIICPAPQKYDIRKQE